MLQDHLYDFHQAILTWYTHNGRKNLPWRNLFKDPNRSYKVYISEIMLQQTQVNTVLDRFYFPFLKHFPTLKALANADEQVVLKAWQGLGYYTRARNLHKSVQLCMKQHEGQLPHSLDELQKLPGIGRYTAGAILCFGFDQNVSFVDGNIKRLLSRLFALQNPSHIELQNLSEHILNAQDSFNHNQALLDLGAMICVPKNPLCLLCPLNAFCMGKANPTLYPMRKKITMEHKKLFLHRIILNQTHILLIQSTQKLYQGLYNLIESDDSSSTPIYHFKHSYTRYHLDVSVHEHHISSIKELPNSLQKAIKNHHASFQPLSSLHALPLSQLCLKALKGLCIH